MNPLSKISVLWTAARPKTLPAAFAPIALASALAHQQDSFLPGIALLCLLFALLVQILCNWTNDCFDFKRGADTAGRLGPTRVTAAGLVTPNDLILASAILTGVAFLVGLGLLAAGGWWLLPLGLFCLLFAWGYTAGPFPLAYHGLGDLFVFIFFGLVAVGATYYLQVGSIPLAPILGGSLCGLLAVNLLLVNNLRDVESDRACGKRTLVVRLGTRWGTLQYAINVVLALIAWSLLALSTIGSAGMVIGFLFFIPGSVLALKLYSAQNALQRGALLPPTAAFLLINSLGLSFIIAAA